jgi:hypothetical protein
MRTTSVLKVLMLISKLAIAQDESVANPTQWVSFYWIEHRACFCFMKIVQFTNSNTLIVFLSQCRLMSSQLCLPSCFNKRGTGHSFCGNRWWIWNCVSKFQCTQITHPSCESLLKKCEWIILKSLLFLISCTPLIRIY